MRLELVSYNDDKSLIILSSLNLINNSYEKVFCLGALNLVENKTKQIISIN